MKSSLSLALDYSAEPRDCELSPEEAERRRRHWTARPFRCVTGSSATVAPPSRLPFPDCAFDEVRLLDQLELIRDEDSAIGEIARVLKSGGRLIVRVPSTGPLAGFDGFNLYKYFADIVRRGQRAPDIAEIGWRRHYSVADLTAVLGDSFTIESVRRSRLFVTESVRLAILIAFRLLHPSLDRYVEAQPIVRQIARIEDRVRVPFGFLLTVEARRRPPSLPVGKLRE